MVSLEQQAVDLAFISHVGKLFETFCAAIKLEPEYVSVRSHARQEFEKDYAFARLTHQEMIKHLDKQA